MLPVLNIIIYVIAVLVNTLAAQRIFHHDTLIDVYRIHSTMFTPAAFTFVMWYVILLALGIFVVYQALPAYRDNPLVKQRIGFLFLLHGIGLIAWPIFWNYRLLWPSVLAMLWLLATVIAIYVRLDIDYSSKGQNRTIEIEGSSSRLSTYDFWIVQTPFSLVLGWVLVMSLLNLWIAISPSSKEAADVWSYSGWSSLLMTLLTIASTLLILFRSDFVCTAVVSWFLFGVADAHRGNTGTETAALVNGFLVLVGTLMTAFFVIFRYYSSRGERAGYAEIRT